MPSTTSPKHNFKFLCASASLRETFLLLLVVVGVNIHAQEAVRVATFNASLNRPAVRQLAADLDGGQDPQARKVAAILGAVHPDVILLNEFDRDPEAARLFTQQYLTGNWHVYQPATNTGKPSGADLNHDGTIGGAPDAHGWGEFPGQYGLLVLSRLPIDVEAARTFGQIVWAMQPDSDMPRDYYRDDAAAAMHLSSKNHVDVPVQVGEHVLHLLVSHPTPPVFDGPEDRNGLRNFDEIRLWADYLTPGKAAYLGGALPDDAAFVILGDMNADPHDGESVPGAIAQLLGHPRVQDPRPTSRGAVLDAEADGGVNTEHTGDPALDTADFPEGRGPGNLRADYVLPSRNLEVVGSGVFWPTPDETGHEWLDASDHRLVWVDLRWPRNAD